MKMNMPFKILPTDDITYLENMLFDKQMNFKLLSYRELKDVPTEHLAFLGKKYALYTIPTVELIEFLEKQIGKKKDRTIEIGAGAGLISKFLGITATDSYMQEREEIKAIYKEADQPTVRYGEHVLKYEAFDAVRFFKPQIVIASWCTHKYRPNEHWREGNVLGIEEEKILKKVNKYIHIGNQGVHKNKPILAENHITVQPDWLLSRAYNDSPNVIWVW